MTQVATVLAVMVSALVMVSTVWGMSDTYGHNPQHDFGSVFGQSANPLIPFWKLEGDAFANQDYVRLVPDRQSKRGGIWNTEPNRFQNWEATFAMHIHGQGALGADGLSFWYTKETSKLDGGFFGFTDQFTGLGIVLDTYDNDNTGLHPLLVAIVNDGTKKYTHQHHAEEDGGSPVNMEVGNCQLHVRNLAGTTFVRVTYRARQLKVEHQIYGQTSFSLCLVANNIDLPTKYHFGFTAATGHMADDHDIYGFSVRNLDANAPTIDSQRLFSSYDKYQIAEYLSRMNSQLESLSSSSSGQLTIGGGDSGRVSSELSNRVNSLEQGLQRVEQLVREVSTNLNRDPARGNTQIQADLATIKTTLAQLSLKVGGGQDATAQAGAGIYNAMKNARENVLNNNNNNNDATWVPSPAGSSSWWSYLLYIVGGLVVLVLLYVAFLFYRVRSEREKKYF